MQIPAVQPAWDRPLRRFFSGLADHADGLAGPGEVRLADTVASLLITAFTDVPAERADVPTDLADRILCYALASLHDPGLSAGSVAHRHGIPDPGHLGRSLRAEFGHSAAEIRAWQNQLGADRDTRIVRGPH